jgi:hypothetical protein
VVAPHLLDRLFEPEPQLRLFHFEALHLLAHLCELSFGVGALAAQPVEPPSRRARRFGLRTPPGTETLGELLDVHRAGGEALCQGHNRNNALLHYRATGSGPRFFVGPGRQAGFDLAEPRGEHRPPFFDRGSTQFEIAPQLAGTGPTPLELGAADACLVTRDTRPVDAGERLGPDVGLLGEQDLELGHASVERAPPRVQRRDAYFDRGAELHGPAHQLVELRSPTAFVVRGLELRAPRSCGA